MAVDGGEALARVIRNRYSCRAYRPDPVPRAHLESMLEAARLAPSACNRQPWRFAVVTAPERRAAIVERGLLPLLPSHWVAGAPVLIVMGMELSSLTHRLAPLVSRVDYPWIDLGIAGEHLVLRATELGLGTCWVGWIRVAALRRIVGWPRAIHPAILFTVGWPAGKAPAPDARARRRPASELVTWIESEAERQRGTTK